MEAQELIVKLCKEAGEQGSERELVKEWGGNHACCCKPHVDDAVLGDVVVLNNIRRCMGLSQQ